MNHDTVVCACPAKLIEMEPPHIQLQVLLSSKAVNLPIHTSETPGDQGDTVAGTQGIGVNTPIAALVAAATVGLEVDEQVPNDIMFTKGV